VQQARDDENRISNGVAPLHPELAQIFPATYGRHALSGPPLSKPKIPRVRHDTSAVTGIASDRVTYMKAALRQAQPTVFNAFSNVGLSAQTGRLATVSTPLGPKPLWGVKGMGLPPYIRNIAKAIMRKRGIDESHAIAIAKASTSKWAAGGGSVKPEVRAASAATNADWEAKRARAHAHANAGDYARAIIELTGTAAGAAADTKSTLTGQFIAKGSAQAAGGAKNDKAKATARAHAQATAKAKTKAKAKGGAKSKAGLLATASADRAKAKALGAQLKILQAALASAGGKVTTSQAGSKTASAAPAKKTTAAPAPAATAKAAAAAPAKPGAAAKPGATPTTAQIKTAIAGLTKQIAALNTAAEAATKQAQSAPQ